MSVRPWESAQGGEGLWGGVSEQEGTQDTEPLRVSQPREGAGRGLTPREVGARLSPRTGPLAPAPACRPPDGGEGTFVV